MLFSKTIKELKSQVEALEKENATLKLAGPKPSAATPPPLPKTQPPTPSPVAKLPAVAPKGHASPLPSTSGSAAITSKRDFIKESKLMTRDEFSAMKPKDQGEFMRNGGRLVAMQEHGSAKDAAAECIKFLNDTPDNVAEALTKGFGLNAADAEELLMAWGANRLDSNLKAHTEASLKASLAKAQKSTKPVGYLVPAPSAAVGTGGRTRIFGDFKAPGEVPENERLAAETSLMELYAEFEAITNPTLKTVWWERNRERVFANATTETKRGNQWIGHFVTQLPHQNSHLF